MFFDGKLADMDAQITKLLKTFPLKEEANKECPASTKSKYPQKGKNDLRTKENLRDILYHIPERT